MSAPIYLDYQATTPVAPEVAAAMRPWIEEKFANPHSAHKLGREAAAAIEVARDRVIDALHSFARDERVLGGVYFTSGATEAANWALKGAAARLPEGRRRIVTVATEHACVLDTVEWLGGQGYEIEMLPVGRDGLVDLNLAAERIDDRTGLVAVMLVNNEIGAVQPVAEIGSLARARGALLFCDAVQGFGRVELPLGACDMVALSGAQGARAQGDRRALAARRHRDRPPASWRRPGGRHPLRDPVAGSCASASAKPRACSSSGGMPTMSMSRRCGRRRAG